MKRDSVHLVLKIAWNVLISQVAALPVIQTISKITLLGNVTCARWLVIDVAAQRLVSNAHLVFI